MRVKWIAKSSARGSNAVIGGDALETWQGEDGEWTGECELRAGAIRADHCDLPSERAAKREAVRMWRALRGVTW